MTGIRRCGKSYLLRTLFKNHLIENGVDEGHIIEMVFDLCRAIEVSPTVSIVNEPCQVCEAFFPGVVFEDTPLRRDLSRVFSAKLHIIQN